MKIIIRKKNKVNKPKASKRNNNMAKKKAKKKSSSRKSKMGFGDGKIFGQKIPIVSDFLKNSTVKKVMVSSGAVATIGGVVALVNNPTANRIWNHPVAKPLTAAAAGDIVGGAGYVLLNEPSILNRVTGRSVQSSAQSSQVGFA